MGREYYISREDVAKKLKNEKLGKDFIVVDVRDDDYQGGNIKGAINIPSAEFSNDVNKLVEDTKEVPLIVFHCALSQYRGPKCAMIFQETRRSLLEGEDADADPVRVLEGGFESFQEKFKDDPDLVENWDSRKRYHD